MTCSKIFILFGLFAFGFLIPSEVAARNIGAEYSQGVTVISDGKIEQVVEGEYKSVTNGDLTVTLQVKLIKSEGEFYGTVHVYGEIMATLGTAPDDRICFFSEPTSWSWATVGLGHLIPLFDKALHAPRGTKLTIMSDLWDRNTFSANVQIAKGNVDFTLRSGTQSQRVRGEKGEVEVIVTCK